MFVGDQGIVGRDGSRTGLPVGAEKVDRRGARQQQLCLILYPKELEDETLELLEAHNVPGYTAMPKMLGRGRRIRHFDNAVWPGATGAVFTVLERDQAAALAVTFRHYAQDLDARSRGLYGVHMFALPCSRLI